MSNHTGPVCACQDHAHPPRGETPAAPSSTSPDTIDRRLVQRYGTALLTGGYTALPTYAWVYYARLGVTEAEMVCLAQLCTYWWSARAPYPGEAALAARMGKTVRTIQGYLRSLEAKGFLHIEIRLSNHGQQRTNSYDLRPFFAAVEGLARLDGLLDNAAASELSPLNHESGACAEQGPLCAGVRKSGTDNRPTSDGTSTGEGGEGSRPRGEKKPSPQVNPVEIDPFDLDSIPPTPTNASPSATSATTTPPRPATPTPQPPELVGREGPARAPRSPDTRVSAPAPATPDDDTLAARVAAIGERLGDEAPASSMTRARGLYEGSGLALPRFHALLDEAAGRTQARQDRIIRMRRQSDRPNAMPYLFAVLADLLDPAPSPHMRVSAARHAPRSRRRSIPPRAPTASFSAGALPAPITEEDPTWRGVLSELAVVLTPENFNRWFARTRALSHEGGRLRVAVPDPFDKAWLEGKLAGRVTAALARTDAPTAHVEYVVEGAA